MHGTTQKYIEDENNSNVQTSRNSDPECQQIKLLHYKALRCAASKLFLVKRTKKQHSVPPPHDQWVYYAPNNYVFL
jgi:hypothetical protein